MSEQLMVFQRTEVEKDSNVNIVIQRLDKTGELVEMTPVLLLDVSGSMNQTVAVGKTKIEVLNEVVKNNFSAIRKFAFSDRFYEVFGNELTADGSTGLIAALRHLPKMKLDLCLLSDGLPTDNENDCIEEAKKLGYPVNVMYIGDKGDSGEAFMIRLAKETDGKILSVDAQMLNPEKLSDNMTKLLLK